MSSRSLLFIGAFLVAMFCSIWVFNHIDPWIGILMAVVALYITISKFVKQSKQKPKNGKN